MPSHDHSTRRRVCPVHAPPTFASTPEYSQTTRPMALLVDKHRPRNLDAFSYHPELSDRLRALVSNSAMAPAFWSASNRWHCRHKAAISHISLYTVPLAQARRRALLRRSKNSTAPVSKRLKSMRASSRPPRTANLNSTLSLPSTTSRSRPQMSETMIEWWCRTCSRRLRRHNKLT